MSWLNDVKWDRDGLVPAIAQEVGTGDVLMFAFMNRDALEATAMRGEAVYWSRSRGRLWHKGEESGHVQKVHELRLDCDNDVVLMKVEQMSRESGGAAIACHTGRHSNGVERFDRQEEDRDVGELLDVGGHIDGIRTTGVDRDAPAGTNCLRIGLRVDDEPDAIVGCKHGRKERPESPASYDSNGFAHPADVRSLRKRPC